jgi:hypothetical protein
LGRGGGLSSGVASELGDKSWLKEKLDPGDELACDVEPSGIPPAELLAADDELGLLVIADAELGSLVSDDELEPLIAGAELGLLKASGEPEPLGGGEEPGRLSASDETGLLGADDRSEFPGNAKSESGIGLVAGSVPVTFDPRSVGLPAVALAVSPPPPGADGWLPSIDVEKAPFCPVVAASAAADRTSDRLEVPPAG